jgi:hypothetical protein
MGGDYGSVLLSALGDGKSKTPQVSSFSSFLIDLLSNGNNSFVACVFNRGSL